MLLTLDAKRLEMSSGDKRAHPLVVSITVSSLHGPLLSVVFESKDDLRERLLALLSEGRW